MPVAFLFWQEPWRIERLKEGGRRIGDMRRPLLFVPMLGPPLDGEAGERSWNRSIKNYKGEHKQSCGNAGEERVEVTVLEENGHHVASAEYIEGACGYGVLATVLFDF